MGLTAENKIRVPKRLLPVIHLVINPYCPEDSLACRLVFSICDDHELIINCGGSFLLF